MYWAIVLHENSLQILIKETSILKPLILMQLIFMVILLTFSWYVMTSVGGVNYSGFGRFCEIFVCIWAAGDLIEEVKSAVVSQFLK